MANSETFSSDSTVTIGNPTKASNYADLANNTDYVEEALAKIMVPADADGRIVQLLTEVAAGSTKVLIDSNWDPASGTPAAHQAIRWRARMSDSANNQDVAGALDWVMTTVTSGAEVSRLDIYTLPGSSTEAVALSLTSTLLDIKAGVIIEANNAIRWDTGVAVVAGAYSVGRDADATNQLHLNVPTGAGIELSVNDVAALTLDATTLTFIGTGIVVGDNDWIGLGASSGRVEFDDQATDEINFLLCSIGVGNSTPGSVLPSGFNNVAADSFVIDVRSVVSGDTGLFLMRSDGSLGLQVWHDFSTGDSYFDNRYDNATVSMIFRGRTAGTPVTAMSITGIGNVIMGSAALATTATDGHLYIPSCAGAPTGVPTTATGRSPIIHDTTNNRIYLYDMVSAAWQYAALT